MIHPTAIVEAGAQIAADAEIGPFCTVGGKAVIGSGTRLISHVSVQGATTLGSSCTVHPFVSLGGPPQDITYKDEDTTCAVGDKNVIREYVTINRGTKASGATIARGAQFHNGIYATSRTTALSATT